MALITSLITFVVSLVLLTKGLPTEAIGGGKFVRMLFEEQIEWLPEVGISYHLGVDGLSILFVLLTTLLTPISIIASWSSVNTRVREFHISMLLLETGMIGAFISLDLFLFYVFFELSLIPMALIIGIWGSNNRVYSAIKFFLYTLAGSLLMLVAIVATYQSYFNQTGERTLDVIEARHGRAYARRRSSTGSSAPSSSPSRSRCRCGRCTPGCPTPMPRRRPPAR